MTRYAIAGCGMMGREHIRNLALIDGAELVAVTDPDAGSRQRALAEAGGAIALFEDAGAMMRDAAPDAVIIASPNHTHRDVVETLAPYAPALLVEKPLATTVEDARALHAFAQGYGALFWVGLEYRFMPPVAALIGHVHDGLTGSVKILSIREHRFPFLPKVGDWNRFSANTGGTLVEKCCHFFDLMRVILRDEPTRIYASGAQDVNHLDERYGGHVPDILDNALAVVDFAGGARASLDLCMFAEGAPEQEEISVTGPVGRLDVSIPGAALAWHPRNHAGGWRETVETPAAALAAGTHHGATFFQLRAFHRALVAGGAPVVSSLDGLRSVEMGAAAHRSIETGQAIDMRTFA